MTPELHGSHQTTYDAIFRHPAAHNLQWRDVRALLNVLADVTDQPNGSLKVTRNGQTVLLHPAHEKDVTDVRELMQLRHFLDQSGTDAHLATADGRHLLVVIDHREARIFEAELHGARPQSIKPYDPHGFGRSLHYTQDDANGQRKPESARFYESVAKTLLGAQKILLFGSGTGTSSAMDRLLAELKLHHKPLADRVVGSVVIDETHLTDDQILAQARAFYERAPAAPTG